MGCKLIIATSVCLSITLISGCAGVPYVGENNKSMNVQADLHTGSNLARRDKASLGSVGVTITWPAMRAWARRTVSAERV